jgi:hypothetical protein
VDGLEPAPGIGLRLLDNIRANLVAASDSPVEVPMEAQPLEADECLSQESDDPWPNLPQSPLDWFWSKPAFRAISLSYPDC